MKQENSSFWTDIKTFEEQLAKAPDSFCFARLSEVYLKVGLADDAMNTARQGVSRHPGYLAGQRALAMACNAKGLNEECLAALKRVTMAMPEDHQSQKMLGRLSAENGDKVTARLAFQTVLEFSPDDLECRNELEALDRSSGVSVLEAPKDKAEEEIIELTDFIEEFEVPVKDKTASKFEEDELVTDIHARDHTPVSASLEEPQNDPFANVTLAELYANQGFIDKSLEIYRSLLAKDPQNDSVRTRISALESLNKVAPESAAMVDYEFEEIPEEIHIPEPLAGIQPIGDITAVMPESAVPSGITVQEEVFIAPPVEKKEVKEAPQQGIANNAISTLEGWLENIRRVKSCR